MLFRPEEIHSPSAKGTVFARSADGTVGVAHHRVGLDGKGLLVSHLDHERLSAVQAQSIDPNRLVGEQPADRQRFKPSLGEPLLMTLDGDAVLCGLIVERRKGGD